MKGTLMRNTSKKLRWIIIFGLIMIIISSFLLLLLSGNSLQNIHKRLLKTPEPLPKYILGLAPFPGTIYPIDANSQVYWTRSEPESVICIHLDAEVMDSRLTYDSGLDSYDFVSTDDINLYLNNQPYGEIKNLWQNSDGNFYSVKIKSPGHLKVGMQANPIQFCWGIGLEPGPYLAEILIQSEISGTLSYKWAFEVIESPPQP